jgi:RNA polymerase sigma factor
LESGKRARSEILFSDAAERDGDGDEKEFDAPDPHENPFDNPMKWELEAIKQECAGFEIDFLRLPDWSPKAGKTKEACLLAARHVLRTNPPPLLAEMRRTGNLPIKHIADALGIQRKIIERHRPYIIVLTVIADGDYPCLVEWLGLKKKVLS